MQHKKRKKYVKVIKLRKGKAVEVRELNELHGRFLMDQQYAFQCAPQGEGEESITVIRMTIPKGTKVEEGYQEVWNSLKAMGYNPAKVCLAMGFTELFDWACTGCQGSMLGCDSCKRMILAEED